jgi:hypothetical protein
MRENPVKKRHVQPHKVMQDPEQRNINVGEQSCNTPYKNIMQRQLLFVFQKVVPEQVQHYDCKKHMNYGLRHLLLFF